MFGSMYRITDFLKYLALVVILSGCAIGATDPDEITEEDKANKYTDVAIEYIRLGDNVNARNWLKQALEFDDDLARAHSMLGSVFQSEKEYVLAEKYFKESIRLEPKSAMFHNNYGVFLFEQARYKEACIQLEQATKDPFYNRRASAFDNLGRCYQEINETKKAAEVFQKSVNLGGKSPYALLSLADELLKAGETFKAEEKYNEFLNLLSANRVEHNAQSLILGIELARAKGTMQDAVTYSLLLENLFPKKYTEYKESGL